MVKNFIPTCDLCRAEMSVGEYMRRTVPPNGFEVLMVVLENMDLDIEFVQNDDGSLILDTCVDCYTRMPFGISESVN